MKDKASNFPLNELKVPTMHGHTKIELKNVKTGLVERIHSENTFQGGMISKFMRTLGKGYSLPFESNYNSPTDLRPLYKSVVGGLFLFKNGINVGTEYMPAGNVMVGAGVRDTTHSGEPTEYGSFNSTESSVSASAITQVYDFTTDQANGQIGCVCLTSKLGAQIGYGHNSAYNDNVHISPAGSSSSTDLPWGRLTRINGSDYQIATVSQNAHSIYGSTIIFAKARYGVENFSVFDNIEKPRVTFDLSTIEGNPFTFTSSTYGDVYLFSVGGGKFRFIPCGTFVSTGLESGNYRYVNAGEYIPYYEYDATNDTLVLKKVINSTGQRIGYDPYIGVTAITFTADDCLICNTYSPYNHCYKINLNTGVTIKDFGTEIYFGSYGHVSASGDCGIGEEIAPGLQLFRNPSNKMLIYDTVNDTLKRINLNGSSSENNTFYNRDLDILESYATVGYASNFWYNSSCRITNNPLYLATINNIQPVTKTAAQTMKVTYTLTEV